MGDPGVADTGNGKQESEKCGWAMRHERKHILSYQSGIVEL